MKAFVARFFAFCLCRNWLLYPVAFAGLSTNTFLWGETIGLPPTRIYSLIDIGVVSPGIRLGFDPMGRISVIQYNKYLVLNDNEWINLMENRGGIDYALTQVAYSSGKQAYFVSHGHWGKLEKASDGKFNQVSLSPEKRPEWTLASEFDHILFVDNGVLFYNWNGLVFWNEFTGEHKFLEILGLESVFRCAGELYVSILNMGLRKLNLDAKILEPLNSDFESPDILQNAISVSADSILFSDPEKGFILFDGQSFKAWKTELDHLDPENIVHFCHLAGGDLAVAVKGVGIFVLSPEGKINLSLTSSEYTRVKEIVANEPGVFWFSADSGVGKVFYGSGITLVDQRSGLQLDWPQVIRWDGGIVVASDGKIYESVEDETIGTISFQLVEGQPDFENLTVAAHGKHMLIGNGNGVIGKKLGGSFERILSDIDVARIVFVDEKLCYIIGSFEITAVQLDGDRWVECVERIPGVGFPSVVHEIKRSVWIELGLNRVARISFKDGKLSSTLLETFPWEDVAWVNVSSVDEIVILSIRGKQRIYFDEATESFCEAPELDAIFELSPFGVWRAVKDDHEIIWVSHNHGVSELRKVNGQYRFDLGVARIVRVPTSVIRILGEGEIWVLSRDSLYCIQRAPGVETHYQMKPHLDSVRDARTGTILDIDQNSHDLGILGYESNNLSFRFFAGTYAFESLSYRVEVKNQFSSWSIPATNSHLTIPNLKEGKYEMRIQLVDMDSAIGEPLLIHFSIKPPWYRTNLAYGLYGVSLILIVVLLASIPVTYVRNRNQILTRLVDERTQELQDTMEKLREKERNSVIHEERSRIAHEMHDSVQQGLSGLKLILDSTLKYELDTEEIRKRLNKATTILAFTHQEVQHAVWNMENPLLQDGNLKSALDEITALMHSNSRQIRVIAAGEPVSLPIATNHHLLRIVQESITNALRHGDARNITISLEYSPVSVVIEITDDGSGFDVDEIKKSPHQLGLRGMLSRVSRFNGTVDIKSEIFKGTCITIKVPVHNAHSNE